MVSEWLADWYCAKSMVDTVQFYFVISCMLLHAERQLCAVAVLLKESNYYIYSSATCKIFY